MKKLLTTAILCTCAATMAAQSEPIRIDLAQKGAVVSPDLYGIFFEEINHAGDGGLYAELVQNRGFEEHVLPSSMTYKKGKAYAIDGQELASGEPPVQTRQLCQAGYDEQTGEMVIKVVNGTDKPYVRCFDIAGAKNVIPTGKVITLCGDAEDENTFEQPTKIAPQTTIYGKFDKQFSYEFAPMSFTILRIKATR